MNEFIRKITSRKFLISCAAFLGSLGTSIVGLRSDNEIVAAVGIVCAMLSAAIYAGCEAAVDKAGAQEVVQITAENANVNMNEEVEE